MSRTPGIPVILQTATRPIHSIGGGISSVCLSACSHGAEFAQAIWERYTGRVWPWSPQSLVLRQDRPAVAGQYLQQHLHTHIAPRLNLTVLTWPARSNDPLNGAPILPMTRVRVEPEMHVPRTFIQTAASSAPEQLASRVIASNRRVEAGPVTTPANSKARLPILGVQPVPRTVRHEAPMETERGSSTRPAESSPTESQAELKAGNSRPRPGEGSLDLNQLTDQVIRAIDHRIIAQRERLGRI